MSEKTKAILKRFLKGFLAGAITAMSMVTIFIPKSWLEVKTLLIALLFAAIGGGINGLILAAQKWISWQDNQAQ